MFKKTVRRGVLVPFVFNGVSDELHSIPRNICQPSEANVLIVVGMVTKGMVGLLHKVYSQLQDPKLVGLIGLPLPCGMDDEACRERWEFQPNLIWRTGVISQDTVKNMLMHLSNYL